MNAPTPHDTPAALQALRELPLPAPVSYTPQTIGWAFVLLLLCALALTFAWIAWRRYERARYRREALGQLARIEQRIDANRLALAEIAPLLKRTALAVAPREHVAALSGAQWIEYLQKTHRSFDAESGALLFTSSYAPCEQLRAVTSEQASRLVNAAREWIAHHHVGV